MILPCAVLLYPLHEEVRDPHSIEQVTRSLHLIAVILLQVKELDYVSVPGLEVHSDGA
jgi:hypothetical protein